MKSRERLLLAGAALLALAAVFAAICRAARPAAIPGVKTVTVEITHSDGRSGVFTVETGEEYLGQALLNEGLIRGEEDAFGLYVTEADGEAAVYEENKAYWAFYQNGEYAARGVGQTPVADGDSYGFVYTIG